MQKPRTTQQGAPVFPRGMSVSRVHFTVHSGLSEVRAAAQAHGWNSVSAEADEVRFTTDGWKTTRVVKSTDQPPTLTPDGNIYLPDVKLGTEVEFAVKVGVTPGAGDAAAAREEIWLNNGGQNYRQVTK